MDHNEWYRKAAQSILDADEETAKELAEQSLEAGVDPLNMINLGFTEGIREMGEQFDRGEVFLPGLVVASEAMVSAVKILEAALPKGEREASKGVVVVGTVEGDIHDIGKGIIATMFRVQGFEVHDLGRDVPIDQFVEKAKEVDADAVGSSAMMTTTQVGQKKIEQALKDAGLRERVVTMVGGAVATDHWARRIGADMWGESPQDAIAKLKELLDK